MYKRQVYEWQNGRGDVLLRFFSPGMGPSGWPYANMFWQPELEAKIENVVSAQPSVTVRRGWQVEDLGQTADEVTLSVRRVTTTEIDDWRTETTPTGDASVVAARFVVGCDGANSTVRQLLGASMTDPVSYTHLCTAPSRDARVRRCRGVRRRPRPSVLRRFSSTGCGHLGSRW